MAEINTTETTKRVNGDIDRTNKDVTKTTTYKPSTEIKQKISMPNYEFIGPDGTRQIDPNALARENDYQQRLREQHKIDENGKFIGDRGDLFGFNPDRYIKEQEAKAKLERFKQKEAGWKNALGVVSDILTAGHGGNVWERKPDEVAAKADEKAVGYEENARKMAAAIPQAIAAREAAYNEARNKHLLDLMQESTITYKQGGGKEEETVGGGYKQTGGGYTKTTKGNKGGSGIGYGSGQQPKVFTLKMLDQKGGTKVKSFDMPQKDYEELADLIQTDMAKVIYKASDPSATENERSEANKVLEFWNKMNYLSTDANGNIKPNRDLIMHNGEIAGLPMETRKKIENFINAYDKAHGGNGGYHMYTDEENAEYHLKNAQIPTEGNDRSSGGGNSKKDPRAAR